MGQIVSAFALAYAVLAIGCTGDSDGDAAGTARQTVSAPTTLEVAPKETPAASPIVEATSAAVLPGPAEPFMLTPYALSDGLDLKEIFVYDAELGANVLRESETYFNVWLDMNPVAFGRGEDGKLVLFNKTSSTWLEFATTARFTNVVPSGDGRFAAATNSDRLTLLDLEEMTQREIGNSMAPVSFSPDGSHLLAQFIFVAGAPSATEGQYVLIPTAEPAAAMLVPRGSLPSSVGQYWSRWLDNARLLVIDESPFATQVQLFDVSGQSGLALLEEPIPSQLHALSPDGSMLAVESRDDSGSVSTKVYRLEPFEMVTSIASATLGQQANVAPEVWSSDNSRLLVTRDVCGQEERLLAHEIASGIETELARGGIMQWGYSPDGEWVAYTAWPDEGYVVVADGSEDPVFVSSEVQATATPWWSSDSRYVAFQKTVGGYDRCFP